MRALWVVLALGGCYRPAVESACEVRCVANGPCPLGLQCGASGFCENPGEPPCGIGNDGGNDGDVPPDVSSANCPAGMSGIVDEGFSGTLANWIVTTPANGTATITSEAGFGPFVRVVRNVSDGTLIQYAMSPDSSGVRHVFLRFDVSLDNIGLHDVVFAQLENTDEGGTRRLVRLRAQDDAANNDITLEEATIGPATKLGSSFALAQGFVRTVIDLNLDPSTRSLQVSYNDQLQVIPMFAFQTGGQAKLQFGAFVESTMTMGPATVSLDNILVCIAL